jgi:predicted dehydrogenase
VRGAIVGFGEVAQHGHWPAYAASPDLTIVAVVERTPERRRLAEALSPSLRAYESIAALAAAETVEFVDICTPPALHADPMLAAIGRGWHVVCEKPFLIDPAALARARACARDRQLAVVPVHNWKYAPIVRDATARLRSGAIGALERVDIEVERLRDFKGADPLRPNWRRDPAIAGGGILMDHGWHAVYLALEWFGDCPHNVAARVARPVSAAVEDEAEVALSFAGGEASIRLTWNGSNRRNTMRLSGENGTITIADDRLVQENASDREEVIYSPALSAGSHHADWFAALIPDVAAAFRDPERSRGAFEEAASCLDVIQRAYAAADARFGARGFSRAETENL